MESKSRLFQLTLKDKSAFLDLFYEPKQYYVTKHSNLQLSILKLERGRFVLEQLFDVLASASENYVLSRAQLEKYKGSSNYMERMEDIKRKFQEPDPKSGEGGEMILYAMLEGFLGAPKLLSKMNVKSNNRMPVFGSDGVHLLEKGSGLYELILGESKMHSDLYSSVTDAYKSMNEVGTKVFRDDVALVDSQFMQEILEPNDEALDLLEEILIPGGKSSNTITVEKSFGVFLTFDFDVDDIDLSEVGEEGELFDILESRIDREIKTRIETIKDQIKKYRLGMTTFHIFIVPFLKETIGNKVHDVSTVRENLQFRLRWGKK